MNENLNLNEYASSNYKKPAYDAISAYLNNLVNKVFTSENRH